MLQVESKSVNPKPSFSTKNIKIERKFLILLLSLAFVRGLIYLSITPSWQHHDEPTHFERLYWVVESRFRSTPSETALSLPAEISASMCESRFWGAVPCGPLPLPYEEPLGPEALGASSQPLYYYLSAPFQIPFRYAPVEVKLYIGRLVSVALYLIVLLIAYLLLRDLFPGSQEVRMVVPALIALIPGFTEEMSALNNDVGAVAMFSLLLWGIVRLVGYGWSPLSLVWVAGAAVLALFAKRTAAVGVLLGFAAILLSCRRLRWWAWVVGGALILGLILCAFDWSGSASWYELPSPGSDAVRVPSDGPVGQHAVCVRGKGRYLVQELPPAQVERLWGQTVTVGGWVQAVSSEGMVFFPFLGDGTVHTQTAAATSEWQFHAMTVTVKPEAPVLQVRLQSDEAGGAVCYDGVVLAQGEFPIDEPPQFEEPDGEKGIWGGDSFVSVLSNGSGERGWPRLRYWVSRQISRVRLLRVSNPTSFIQSVLDWKRTKWVYSAAWNRLFRSFWVGFGWGYLGLTGHYYWLLLVPTLLGLGGAVIFGIRYLVLARDFRLWQRRVLALFALAILLVWGIAALWYSHPVLSDLPWHPVPMARYAYPAIIPTVLFLFLGWRELVPGRWKRFLAALALFGVAWLDIVSLLGTILPYYYLKW